MRELFALFVAALVALGVFLFFGWYEHRYPCVRRERQWVEGQWLFLHNADGTVVPLYQPGSSELVCVERRTIGH